VDLKVLNRDLGIIVNSRLALTTDLPAADVAPRNAGTPDARQITSGKSLADEALQAIRRNNAHQQASAAAFPPRRVAPPEAKGRDLPVASLNGATPGTNAAMRTMNNYLGEATGRVAAARRTFEAMPASARRDELLALTTATGEHVRRQSFRLNNQWGVGPADLSRSDQSNIAMLQTSMAKIEAGMKEAIKGAVRETGKNRR
jgi:hypothetical protein